MEQNLAAKKETIFSGIQPSGVLTIGACNEKKY